MGSDLSSYGPSEIGISCSAEFSVVLDLGALQSSCTSLIHWTGYGSTGGNPESNDRPHFLS